MQKRPETSQNSKTTQTVTQKRPRKRTQSDPKTIQKLSNNEPKTLQKRSKQRPRNDPKTTQKQPKSNPKGLWSWLIMSAGCGRCLFQMCPPQPSNSIRGRRVQRQNLRHHHRRHIHKNSPTWLARGPHSVVSLGEPGREKQQKEQQQQQQQKQPESRRTFWDVLPGMVCRRFATPDKRMRASEW